MKASRAFFLLAVVFFAVVCCAPPLHARYAQSEEEVTELLKQLHSPDATARLAAIDGLQTSLDSRIPDACLPLLKQDGGSVSRLAARAIGSRWHQIPKERVPIFIAALKKLLKGSQPDLVNMARRGITLLNRSYTGNMVSRSHSGRWVIYERRGRPCLIDAKNGTEELLGFGNSADFMPSSGNAEVAPSAVWHRRKDKVVLDMVQGRKLALLWVWSHDKGLRQFEEEELLKSLGVAPGRIHSGGGFFTADFAWKGDDLHFHLRYTIHQGDDFVEHDARLRWDFATDRLHLLSDKVQR